MGKHARWGGQAGGKRSERMPGWWRSNKFWRKRNLSIRRVRIVGGDRHLLK